MTTAKAMTVLDRIVQVLDAQSIPYRLLHHAPTRTSEESAAVRGEPLEIGAKAIVLKVQDTYRLFVLSAARRLDSRQIKRHFKAKRVRFATAEELLESTGLVPGAVPPFGEPVLPLPLYVDPSILQNDRVAFNAGALTTSIIMAQEAYIALSNPTLLPFARHED